MTELKFHSYRYRYKRTYTYEKLKRRLPVAVFSKYRKLAIYHHYNARYFSLKDLARELNCSLQSVMLLTEKRLPSPDIVLSLENQYYKQYWKWRLILDGYKYVRSMMMFDGTYDPETINRNKLAIEEYFSEYWHEHLLDYQRRYRDFVF